MTTSQKTVITVKATVDAPLELVWALWNDTTHITKWNHASPEWHTPHATSDLRPGGKFSFRMEARDGSMGFDFWGTYDEVKPPKTLSYTIGDGRKVNISFQAEGNKTHIVESFEAESQNSPELQQTGWQAIMDNFKKYAEEIRKKSLHFEISISAPVSKVFKFMLGPDTYNTWTSAFNPTSRYEGSWAKGSDIRFVGTDESGALGGMVSKIEENIENEIVSIIHNGLIMNNQEVLDGPDVEPWKGLREMYRFSGSDGKTDLSVTLEGMEMMKDYFNESWPKALEIIKSSTEK